MDRTLATAQSAARRLTDQLIARQAFDEELAREYNRAKRALATSFQRMALEEVPRDRYRLTDLKHSIQAEMHRLFAGRASHDVLRVRGYTSPHPDVYALLADKLGEAVPGWRIRLVAGDKIHTERRTRELRNLGLAIEVAGKGEDATYCLPSLEADLTYAAAYQLRENVIEAGKRVGGQKRPDLIDLAERTARLPERENVS